MPKSYNQLTKASILALLVVLILFLRASDAFFNPQLWAEDGSVFLVQQREQGSVALFNQYSGYYHLVPRLIALLNDNLALKYIPISYNFAALLCIVATSTPRRK